VSDASTPRRTFLGQLALTTAGLSGATTIAGASAAPLRDARTTPWDDSWTTRLGSTHRFVFDLPQQERAEGVLGQLTSLYDDYHTALDTRDQEMHSVLVIRHAAIALIFNDAVWTKYKIGAANPNRQAIAAWQARGVTVLACNMALMNRVRNLAHDSGQDEKAVDQDVRANLLPGVILQPNGVYAVLRAQDAGCTLYHVG
jgi:intracellular sulfur oxidation DsrE/DsrF family protein